MPARVAVLCDYPEEGWPSMDLVAGVVLDHLARDHAGRVEATRVVPAFQSRAQRIPVLGRKSASRNVDRLVNRVRDYPRFLKALDSRERFDVYHLVDHSYAQLLHVVPPGRAVVTCHDLDTFRCLLDPAREPRPAWFRAVVRRTLTGFQKAAAVVCVSAATCDAVRAHDLIAEDRLHVIPNGTQPECTPEPDPAADAEAARLIGPRRDGPELLHVGSTIARKRIDVLLAVFAGVRRAHPEARLLKAGGALTAEQRRQAEALGIAGAIVEVPFSPPAVLAALYRRAALVLQPSEAEGFGLPVVEALACGAVVLASDLAVLREVGGRAVVLREVGDVPAWTEAALALLEERAHAPASWQARRSEGMTQARPFQWSEHVNRLVAIYEAVRAGR